MGTAENWLCGAVRTLLCRVDRLEKELQWRIGAGDGACMQSRSDCISQAHDGTHSIKAVADKLNLQVVTGDPYSKKVGFPVYMMNAGSDDKRKEFNFTVDDKEIGCGLNGALDELVPRETDEKAGTGKYVTCCTEIDLLEANKISTPFTMHPSAIPIDEQYRCTGTDCGDNVETRFLGECVKNGCDIQSHRLREHRLYGPGIEVAVDSSKPVTVTTQVAQHVGADGGDNRKAVQFEAKLRQILSKRAPQEAKRQLALFLTKPQGYVKASGMSMGSFCALIGRLEEQYGQEG